MAKHLFKSSRFPSLMVTYPANSVDGKIQFHNFLFGTDDDALAEHLRTKVKGVQEVSTPSAEVADDMPGAPAPTRGARKGK